MAPRFNPTDIPAFGRARSDTLDTNFDAIKAAFDGIPADADIEKGIVTYGVDSGAADAYAITLTYVPTAYADGMQVVFKATNSNTGASTVNVNGLGVKSIKLQNGDVLSAGDIAAGNIVELRYNTTSGAFEIQSANAGYLAHALAAQAAAEAALAATAAVYDSFDDRYLGVKISDPALDNDGNPLLEGALYWNSVVKEMRVYNGASWETYQGFTRTQLTKAVGDILNPLCEIDLQNGMAGKWAGVLEYSNATTTDRTYVDRYGVVQKVGVDVPRFESNGLLLEGASTNQHPYSEDILGAGWGVNGGTRTVNTMASPDTAVTADTLTEDGTTGNHRINTSLAGGGAVTYASSIFVKRGVGTRNLTIALYDSAAAVTFGNVTFDLDAGEITGVLTGLSAKIVPIANGWFRCSLVATSPNGTGSISPNYQMNNGAGVSYTGDSTSSLHFWGAQLEVASFVTSYIPTTTAAVTRQIDICKLKFKDNHSKLLSGNFSIIVDASMEDIALSAERMIFETGYGEPGADSYNLLRVNAGTKNIVYYRGTGDTIASTGLDTVHRYGISVSAADLVNTYVDGVQVTSNTRALLTSGNNPTYIGVGCKAISDSASLWGRISKVRIYDVALTDAQMRIA